MTPRELLAQGVLRLGLELPPEAGQRLLNYLALLGKWNQTYNLTAIREPGKVVTHHLLDSLSVLPYVNTDTITDVGSGAGLPGIPLAVAKPGSRVVLIESNHKKGAFLRQAMTELQLTNVEVITERAENWHPLFEVGVVISRAFADLAGFVEIAGHLCSPTGVMLAMKGLYPDEEIEQLPASVKLERVERIDVPGLRATRHLVILRPSPHPK